MNEETQTKMQPEPVHLSERDGRKVAVVPEALGTGELLFPFSVTAKLLRMWREAAAAQAADGEPIFSIEASEWRSIVTVCEVNITERSGMQIGNKTPWDEVDILIVKWAQEAVAEFLTPFLVTAVSQNPLIVAVKRFQSAKKSADG